jgi:hypothetical protein
MRQIDATEICCCRNLDMSFFFFCNTAGRCGVASINFGEAEMQELTMEEVRVVSGGNAAADGAAIGGALGGGAGLSYALSAGSTAGAALGLTALGAAAGAALGASFGIGWAIGSAIYGTWGGGGDIKSPFSRVN